MQEEIGVIESQLDDQEVCRNIIILYIYLKCRKKSKKLRVDDQEVTKNLKIFVLTDLSRRC